jgi:hypothetical protein
MANREQASRARLFLLQASLQNDSLDNSKHKVLLHFVLVMFAARQHSCENGTYADASALRFSRLVRSDGSSAQQLATNLS